MSTPTFRLEIRRNPTRGWISITKYEWILYKDNRKVASEYAFSRTTARWGATCAMARYREHQGRKLVWTYERSAYDLAWIEDK